MQKIQKLKIAICSVLIAIVVLSAIVCTGFFAIKNTNAAKGNWTDYSTNNQDGSKIDGLELLDGYYYIRTPQELAYFNKNLYTYKSANIALAKNIDISAHYWTPNADYKFNGVFEGNNCIISGLTIEGGSKVGLFGTVDSGAIIRNITFKNSVIRNTIGYAGVIAGRMDTVTLKNCNILDCEITYTGTNSVYAGGVAGFATSSKISNCFVENISIAKASNSNSTQPDCYLGGIVGHGASSQILVAGVTGNSSIKAFASSYNYAGGIVGLLNKYSSSNSTTKVDKCFYSGNTVEAGTSDSSYCYAGGIVGQLDYGVVTNCYNCANITATAKEFSGSSTNFNTNLVVNGTAKNEQLCDLFELAGIKNVYICSGTRTDSNAYGDYKNKKYQSFYKPVTIYAYSGGIVGHAKSSTSVLYTYNTGSISSTGRAYNFYQFYFKYFEKGLFGGHHYDFEAGNFTAKGPSAYYKGNIVGYFETANVSNSYATATINPNVDPYATSYNKGFIWVGGEGAPYKQVRQSRTLSGNTIQVYCYAQNGRNNDKKVIVFQKELQMVNSSRKIENLVSENIKDIVKASNSVWTINENINNGNPIIKDFYWQYGGQKP